jgi:predicted metal-binding membrane protein
MSALRVRRVEWSWALVAAGAWLALLLHHRGGAMAGMEMPRPLAGDVAWWCVMAAAMMVPVALPTLRALERGSTLFVAGFLAAWAAFGAVALAVWAAVGGGDDAVAASLLLFAAAAWELTPYKRRCLARCHALPGRFGIHHAGASIGSCGVLMLPMVPLHSVALMTALAALATWQRLAVRPRLAVSAAALAVLAEVVLATAL